MPPQASKKRPVISPYSTPLPTINTNGMNESGQSLFGFMQEQSGKIGSQLLQHIGLTFISLMIAVAIGVPLGIAIAKNRKFSGTVLGMVGVLQTIPSIALL